MRSPFATALAISFGLIVLLGFFIPSGVGAAWLHDIRFWMIDWASILAGIVTFVAILGLVSSHWNKLRARRNPDRYSFFLLAGFAVTFIIGAIAYVRDFVNGGSENVVNFQQVVTTIQVPVEASLMALLAVTLTLAGLRLFQRRRGLLPVVFIASVLLFLLVNSGLLSVQMGIPFIDQVLGAIRMLPVAGGRGILLGIALGSIMAGLRIVLGADRPYSG